MSLCCWKATFWSYYRTFTNLYLLLFSVCIPSVAIFVIALRYWLKRNGKKSMPHLRTPGASGKVPVVVGFFHPYCNAGGGGERVLWTAVRAIQNKHPDVRCVIYTGDTDVTGEQILSRVRQRFNIVLPRTDRQFIDFIFLHRRRWVEAEGYPHFTLLGQSLGSLVLGFEALTNFVPDLYIDTMGYAFTMPLFRYLGGCRIACYVHYPTISMDMLRQVTQRTESYNNAAFISTNPILSRMKILYYYFFAFIYGIMGNRSDVVMVNSTWTFNHILTLWRATDRTHIVYPPCNTSEFLELPLDDAAGKTDHSVVSVGQFRPEKNHMLQVKAFKKFLSGLPHSDRHRYRLVLVGSCRDAADAARVERLRDLCEELKMGENVDFKINVSFSELKDCLASATVGLHSMWNEHFGICVVECMAAGTVMLAHNTAGPKMDIVTEYEGHRTGFLADDVDSYAEALSTIFNLSVTDRMDIMRHARLSVNRFSEDKFEEAFLDCVRPLLDMCVRDLRRQYEAVVVEEEETTS